MTKRWLQIYMALVILTLACLPGTLAEGGLNSALTSTLTVTPAPTLDDTAPAPSARASASPAASPSPVPTPAPVIFEGEGLKLTLPAGFELIEDDALDGFEAALADDYPDTASTLFAARNAGGDAAVVALSMEAEVDCLDAAREAADALINDPQAASEAQFGENRCASFACAIADRGYYLYFFSDGQRLIIIGTSGLDDALSEEMLAGLELSEPDAPPDATPSD